MQWLFILIAVAWVVIGIAGNKKRQQARAEAEKQAAQGQQQNDAAPEPSSPFSPFYPEAPAARPAAQPVARPQQQPAMRPKVQMQNMQDAPKSTLTQIQQTQRHILAPSGEAGGHAHQETSMTGFEPDCPQTPQQSSRQTQQTSSAALPAFSWQPNAVLNGMVYAEILDKPKALRH